MAEGSRTETAGENIRWLTRLMAAAIASGCALVYAGVLRAPFVFDDCRDILDNPSIRSLLPPSRMFFADPALGTAGRPVVNASFALDWALSGSDPIGYHLTDALLHALSALLLFGILRRLMERLVPGGRAPVLPIAFFTAFAWAVHPVSTSVVSLAFQRPETLYAFFCLLSVYFCIRGFSAVRSRPWYFGASIALLLAAGSKETAAALPFFILLLRPFFARKEEGRTVLPAARPLFPGFFAAWLLVLVLDLNSGAWGRATMDSRLSPVSYAFAQGVVVLRYIGIALFPAGLCADRVLDPPPPLLGFAACALVAAVAAAGAAALYRRRPAGLAVAWFLLFLAPSSSLVPLSRLMADHRLYLPLAAVCFAAAWGLWKAARLLALRLGLGNPALLLVPLAAAWVAALGVAAVERNAVYGSNLSFWKDTVVKSPENPKAWLGLGVALSGEGRLTDAERAYRRALGLDPGYAEALNNLGAVLLDMGRSPEALAAFRRMKSLAPGSPQARDGLGRALIAAGRLPEALVQLRAAVALDPGFAMARFNLADALFRSGKKDEAISEFRKAVESKPDFEKAHMLLSSALLATGRLREAAARLEKALALFPENPQLLFNMGRVLLEEGRPERAVGFLEKAARLSPRSAYAQDALGMALSLSGRFERAIGCHRRALALAPDFYPARVHLGVALAETGRIAEARKELGEALRENPGDAAIAAYLGRLGAPAAAGTGTQEQKARGKSP